MARQQDAPKSEFKETIVNIRRVAKTVKGGRNMRFSVTMVVGWQWPCRRWSWQGSGNT